MALAGLVLVLSLILGAGQILKAREYPDPVPLQMAGLLGNEASTYAIPPEEARGASYLPGSNVLRLPDGNLRYLPIGETEPVTVSPEDPGAQTAVEESRSWLDQGSVPGSTEKERRMAERALLDLRLLTDPNGAAVAGRYERWNYVWPRDASWAAVAFAANGHHDESYEILEFLATVQNEDGTWEARYKPGGAPLLDGRDPQLDATGWFPWAVWFYSSTASEGANREAEALWPAVNKAADAAADSLGPGGLPPGGADYWEISTWRPNLGTAAPLRTGLRSSADLAAQFGYDSESRRYTRAADRLDEAIRREFAPDGYQRTTRPGSGADAAVNFAAPPFAPPDEAVERSIADAAKKLRAPNGGMLPGEKWRQKPTVAWTPETAFFALSAAASGDEEKAGLYIGWLAEHRTNLGSFPEKVDGAGDPQAVAPLGWTSATVVLALTAKEEPLPTPPEYETL
ncbi:MAG: glycoside hydrolase family 15 protein [Rubrobacteraceae bacterium]